MTDPLKGERVALTPLQSGDAASIAAWREDGGYLRMLDAAPAYPGAPADVAQGIASTEHGTAFPFAVRSLADRRLIGWATLDGILWNQGNAWLAVGIGRPEDRGKGYGSDTVRTLLRFGFGELNLRRVTLTVFSYNVPAIRLYERLGFVREGAYREFLRRDGEAYDMYLYGLLRREHDHKAGGAAMR